ncbi:hypothetical protein OOK41_29110 [Micromonospora sp. NBC_01655]|uniref:hypothetical protein n=1 Tax=Micromonospora sp. NBC_01655 TaxID=2975983 RepID=UPI00225AB702|nr:hypothetical protein [Micromonospora sp. NBC_01655]MCX4474320.1 hypothetical protein [Micromonospora sp. NBC_01655]
MNPVEVVTERARAARSAVVRVSPAPLLVRAGIFGTVLAGLLLAYPVQVLTGRPLAALAVVALLPAIAPRRLWPTFAALVTVGGWLLATEGYDRPIALWRLLAVAVALYLAHSLCALAALLPYDAVVDPELVVRWLSRAGGVLLASAALGVLLVEVSGLGADRGFLAATVVGLLGAVALSALLGWLWRRR